MTYVVFLVLFVAILAFAALLSTERGKPVREYIKFFSAGLDSGFKFRQIILLGRIGRSAKLEDLTTLFWSVPALDRCTAEIVRRSKLTGTETDSRTQQLLSLLYAYRTNLALDQARKKHGLESTREIDSGQQVRVLLRGAGIFASKVVRNGPKCITLDFPYNPSIPATAIEWTGKAISVYLWRHEDAGYVFDSVVIPDPAGGGRALLHVAHSDSLVRSQKRKSIRVKCSIYAQMYLLKPEEPLDNSLEPEAGMKCLIEDLSEDGAMVIIGGKALREMHIKLQFMIQETLIVMAGTVRAVEYNQSTRQSRIHFESGDLNPRMRNAVLAFVYNVLPPEEKEVLDAIRLTEEDGMAESGLSGIDEKLPAGESPVPGPDGDDLPDLPDFDAK
jgi:PilZ domain.